MQVTIKLRFETYDNDLSELCKSIKNGDLEGLNVTVPFKKINNTSPRYFK